MYIHDQLMKARHDGWLRAAAQNRLAAQVRQARAAQRRHALAAPLRRLAAMRLHERILVISHYPHRRRTGRRAESTPTRRAQRDGL